MFGKSIIKLIGFTIAGALALAGGAQILTSAISIVLELRGGNPLPFLIVVCATLVVLRLPSAFKDDNPIRIIQVILTYGITAYLVVVVFVMLIPFGLLISFTGCSLTAIMCSIFNDPSEVKRFIKGLEVEGHLSSSLKIRETPVSDFGTIVGYSDATQRHMFLVPLGQEDNVVSLMRERPLLPISLTRYEDFNVLTAKTGSDPRLLKQIRSLLLAAEIEAIDSIPPLLLEVIQKLPLIDTQFGLSMDEFCYVSIPETVDYLLKNWQTRMTVFPTENGPWVIVPNSVVPGLKTGSIPMGREAETLLLHNFSAIKESANESAATT
jgi:hypothetical protein